MGKELMTPEEIHALGVEIVVEQLVATGHEIIAVQKRLGFDPQIVARYRIRALKFVVVRTACHPGKGELEPAAFPRLVAHAKAHGAMPSFAGVGIANATSTDDAGRSLPVRGAGFHAAYTGLQLMVRSKTRDAVREALGSALDSGQRDMPRRNIH